MVLKYTLIISEGIHFVNSGSQIFAALHNCCSRCSATDLLLRFGRAFMAVDTNEQRTTTPLLLLNGNLEGTVIVEFGTLVGVHGDRAGTVVWIWRGFVGLARQAPQ